MARYSRLKVLTTMIDTGMVPVFYHPDFNVARDVAAACLAGGCRLLEFTNRGDHAWEVFNELEKYCARELPEMILGVGSVVDPGTASLYINCGANFVVGPLLNPARPSAMLVGVPRPEFCEPMARALQSLGARRGQSTVHPKSVLSAGG